MPLVSVADPAVLVDRVRRLRGQAAHHKRQQHFHRAQLRQTKATLAALEAECQARGIPLPVPHRQPGEGV